MYSSLYIVMNFGLNWLRKGKNYEGDSSGEDKNLRHQRKNWSDVGEGWPGEDKGMKKMHETSNIKKCHVIYLSNWLNLNQEL